MLVITICFDCLADPHDPAEAINREPSRYIILFNRPFTVIITTDGCQNFLIVLH